MENTAHAKRRSCDCATCQGRPSWMTVTEWEAYKWDVAMSDNESRTFAAMGN